ncbi:MAG: phosphatidate cytidylyltransferase [Gammaproteobacteria bacterium]|nr:phosphatidate cytidylyltransferase [Gammaproteobacteria bacterium]
MLKQRIITAIVLGAAIVWAIFKLPNHLLALVFGGITLLGAWEWAGLIGLSHFLWRIIYVVFVVALMALTWVFAGPHQVHIILLVAGLWWASVVILLSVYESKWLQTAWLQRMLGFSGFVVLVPSWLALTSIHRQGPIMLMFLLVLVWITDIAAYFVGKRFGKTKLAPKLSPGKSREGLWGALMASILLAIVGVRLFDLDMNVWVYFGCLCLLTALISVVGDLYESLLKRRAGVKDSGRILPGHGGILDRIDSLTAAAPGFVLGLYWLV